MAGHNNLDNWRNHQRFNSLHNRVMAIIGGIACLIVVLWLLVGVVAYKAFDHINEHGLKDTAERIWYGPEGDDETDEANQSD